MATLVQIIYISRATAQPARPENGIDPAVARILAKSRSNNRKNALVGVLYFGDGCFFQCLEGEETVVNTLYAKLEQDPRHKDLTVISRKVIAAPTFQDWSMKYVPVEQAMTKLLQSNGMSSFDPYLFDSAMTQAVIACLLSASEPPEVAAQVAKVVTTSTPANAPVKSSVSTMKLAIAVIVLLAAGALVFAALPR